MNAKLIHITIASILALAVSHAVPALADEGSSTNITTPESGDYANRTDLPGNRNKETSGVASEYAFEQLDSNHNFTISRSEAQDSKTLSAQFDQVDQNHDLQITPAEFSAFEIQQMQSQQSHGKPDVKQQSGTGPEAAAGTPDTQGANADQAKPN